jgi:hypothetical protein
VGSKHRIQGYILSHFKLSHSGFHLKIHVSLF